MFESIINFFKKIGKQEKETVKSKDAAKERLHLVLMQDRANVSADFLDLMKQEIIEVIKKYIDVDENAIDVRLTNKANGDGTNGAPALYANIPILNIKEDVKRIAKPNEVIEENQEESKETTENLEESVEEQNSSNEDEVKTEESGQNESQNEIKENNDSNVINEENNNTSNENKIYRPINVENSTVSNENTTFQTVNAENNNVANDNTFQNANIQTGNTLNENTFQVANVAENYQAVSEENRLRETQVSTEHKEEVMGNYNRTL